MYSAPTFGEVIFWLATALVSTILLIRVLASGESSGHVGDLAAWQRNYERTQLRNR